MPIRKHPVAVLRRAHVLWFMQAMVVVILASMNVSTATYNPGHHPQNPSWNPAQQHIHWNDPARGGSTMTTPEPFHVHEEPYQPPKILLKHMSMALRITSEWNRRLLHGVNRFRFWKRKMISSSTQQEEQQQQQQHHHPVNVHPSRAWHPPIPDPLRIEEDELTLFHAKAPRDASAGTDGSERRGVARWGPELLPYLEHVVDLLGISSDGVEIPLAMIYLDRACSVETPRSNGVLPCPFCTPRTVHRLSLASMLLATQAVNGYSQQDMERLCEKVSSLGIPESQLQQMIEWMRGALGDFGLMVTITQMKEWGEHWEAIFFPHRQMARLEHQQTTQANHDQPQEMLLYAQQNFQ